MFVKVSNPANPALFFEEEFHVEPTAVYCLFRNGGWRKSKSDRCKFERSFNGRRELRLAGEGFLTGLSMQEPRICTPIFSAQNSSYVLGATAFEDLSSEKIASLMSQFALSRPRRPFERGESIKTIDGPFAGFTGIVDEIHTDQNMLKAVVTFLGRSSPIALDFWQVEQGSRLRANWAWGIGELEF